MSIQRIAILGGTGFVGQSLCNQLAQAGYHLKVLTRRREAHRAQLIILPNLDLVETDLYDLEQLEKQLVGCDAVINLVGILNERGRDGQGFEKAHVRLVENLISACAKNGIDRILQMSALNADEQHGKSYYLRSKGKAENLLHNNTVGIQVTSFRPAVIFGQNDQFFNRFARLLKMTPLFFPLACYNTKFAPVYVFDVIEMITRSIENPQTYNKKYSLCGPNTYSLRALVAYTAKTLGLKRLIIPLNDALSRVQAAVFDFVPGKPFSTDNYLSAKTDSVCAVDCFTEFNIKSSHIEAIVPTYLSSSASRSDVYALSRRKAWRN